MADAPVPLTAEEQALLLELVARARATMSPEDAAVAAEEDVDLGESMEAAADMSPPANTDEELAQEMSENLDRTYEQTGEGPEIQEPPEGAEGMPSLEAIARRVIPRSPEIQRLEKMYEKIPMDEMAEMPEMPEMVEKTPRGMTNMQRLLEIARRAQTKARDVGATNMPAPDKEGAEEAE
jgi:hypothetical protein